MNTNEIKILHAASCFKLYRDQRPCLSVMEVLLLTQT